MTTPSVSVIIPTCNRAGLVGTAIRSALGQTLRGLEVIVIDDASEDRTAEVVASIHDPRLRFMRQDVHQGAPSARNVAIRSSSGEFVAFLDDDDEWLPEKLELQIALFRRSRPEVGVVYSSYAVVERATNRVIGRKVAEQRGDLGAELLTRNHIGATSCVVVRRSALDRAGLWDERLPSFQDYDLWIRLARVSHFDFVERDLLKYYVHARRIWTNLEALDRGIALMVEKHGSYRPLRRNLSRQSLGVGVQYCSRGDTAKGRQALIRAIRLDAAAPRAYLNLALSFLGTSVFRGVHAAKKRLLAPGRRDVAPGSTSSPVPKEAGQ